MKSITVHQRAIQLDFYRLWLTSVRGQLALSSGALSITLIRFGGRMCLPILINFAQLFVGILVKYFGLLFSEICLYDSLSHAVLHLTFAFYVLPHDAYASRV